MRKLSGLFICLLQTGISAQPPCSTEELSYSVNNVIMKQIELIPNHSAGVNIYLDSDFRDDSYTENARKYLFYADKIKASSFSIPGWENLSVKEKDSYITNLKKTFIIKADSIQKAETRNIIYFAIENNTPDTIWVQTQDFSIIGLIEAKNKSGEWQPVEYHAISDCNRSFLTYRVAPDTKNYIRYKLPPEGNFRTTARLKAFVNNQIVLSENFEISVDECLFLTHPNPQKSNYIWLGDFEKMYNYLQLFKARIVNR